MSTTNETSIDIELDSSADDNIDIYIDDGGLHPDVSSLRSAAISNATAQATRRDCEMFVTSSAINSAASAGQTSCIIERSLKPETIADLVKNGYIVEGIGRADKSRPVIVDWSDKVAVCIAGSYEDINKNSRVFNKSQLDADVWVQLPASTTNFEINKLNELSPTAAEIDLTTASQENIWVKLPSAIMDISAGKKVYKLTLKHKQLADTLTLYFGYTVQDDNPTRSYVYMQ